MNVHAVKTTSGTEVSNPPIARFLFDDTRMAIVWLVVRLLLAYEWLNAGWAKLNEPGWMVTGDSLKGFWVNAVKVPPDVPRAAISVDLYRSFLQGLIDAQAYTWFAKVVAISEFTIGVLLLVGAFVGVAAFFGAVLNWNFIMAGSASVNGIMFAATVFIILAWKTAGYIGLDRYLLPRLGTPWRPVSNSTGAEPKAAVPEPKLSTKGV